MKRRQADPKVGDRLREARRALGLTQRQFASALSYSTVMIGYMETRRRQPTDAFLHQVADTFQIRFEWLAHGKGNMGGPGMTVQATEKDQLADRVRAVRLKFGLSQGQFAAVLQCSAAHISGLESKRHRPSEAFLKRIAETFRVSYEWLTTGSGDMGGEWSEEAALFPSDRIKQIRSRWCLSQEAFAGTIGATRLTVKYIENGQKQLSEDMLETISESYGVSPQWLQTGEGPMIAEEPVRVRLK